MGRVELIIICIIIGGFSFLGGCGHWRDYIGYRQAMSENNPIEYTFISKKSTDVDHDSRLIPHAYKERSYYITVLYQSTEYEVEVDHIVYENINAGLPDLYFWEKRDVVFSELNYQKCKVSAIRSAVVAFFITVFIPCLILLFKRFIWND